MRWPWVDTTLTSRAASYSSASRRLAPASMVSASACNGPVRCRYVDFGPCRITPHRHDQRRLEGIFANVREDRSEGCASRCPQFLRQLDAELAETGASLLGHRHDHRVRGSVLISGLAGQVALPAPTARRDDLQPMTAAERLDELAQILSAGLRRILPEQSSSLSAQTRDSLVDFSPLKSGVRRHKLRNRVGG